MIIHILQGNYKDGMKTGFGKMIFPNGDIYEGEWLEDKIHGEGSYTYKKSGDIYSGSWSNGKKCGQGRYEYAADSSQLVGEWVDGDIVSGSWELKGSSVYTGKFKLGRPIGEGSFAFVSGLTQTGTFEEIKVPGEEEPAEGEPPKAPNVAWKGNSVVAF